MKQLRDGIYRYEEHGMGGGEVVVSVKDTDKTMFIELISNTVRYLNGNLESLLETGKVAIRKAKSPHAINYVGDSWFCIYPYRNGIPFAFELKGGER